MLSPTALDAAKLMMPFMSGYSAKSFLSTSMSVQSPSTKSGRVPVIRSIPSRTSRLELERSSMITTE